MNWNGGEFTLPCIRSLRAGRRRPDVIVVVDNASTDGSPEAIAGEFPDVRLIRNVENKGFAGGCNIGIRSLLDSNVDLLWVLNNDTVVDAGCLDALVDEMDRDPGVAVATGKILHDDEAHRIWYAGGTLNRWSLTASHRGHGQYDRGQFDSAENVGFVTGCCMLVRKNVFAEVGMFDERFFAYVEDAEWCMRAAERRMILRYVNTATLVHALSGSVRKNSSDGRGSVSPLAHYLQARNRIYAIRLHAKSPWVWCVAVLSCVMHNAYLMAGLAAKCRGTKIACLLRGVWDGVKTRLDVHPTAPSSGCESERQS